MDPAATWKAILDCLAEANYWDAMFHLEEFQDWIRYGGFLPPYVNREVLTAIENGIRDNLE